jgi:hypothetical protein
MTPKEVTGFAYLCKALSVLDRESGKFLEHPQLRTDPQYKPTWDTSYVNKLGQLCQGTGTGPTPGSKPVEGTNTFFRINYDDIPAAKRKKFCHTLVVCEVRSQKDDPDRARITIG